MLGVLEVMGGVFLLVMNRALEVMKDLGFRPSRKPRRVAVLEMRGQDQAMAGCLLDPRGISRAHGLGGA